MLRGDEGHHMLVIGAVAYMVIYKNIGIEKLEDPGKAPCIAAVGFYEISVKIQVAGIATRSLFLWARPGRSGNLRCDLKHRRYCKPV
jgi:hypothetical protein